jgi:predicted Rossmann fold flavoprotein
VPLIVGNQGKWLTELSGISSRVRIDVCSGKGQRLASYENDMLCTHFGLSGPAVMDASRWLTDARGADPNATIRVAWLPGETFESVDRALVALGSTSVLAWIKESLPERLARAICQSQQVDPTTPGSQLTKIARRALAHALVEMPVEVTGDRGFSHAEATAGGVPLTEIDPRTMSSRVCDGLTLIGEILDVDGRIGGFNFQWAWASGMVAGTALSAEMIKA